MVHEGNLSYYREQVKELYSHCHLAHVQLRGIPHAAFCHKALRTLYPSLGLSQRIFFFFFFEKILINPWICYGAVPKSLRTSKLVILDLPGYWRSITALTTTDHTLTAFQKKQKKFKHLFQQVSSRAVICFRCNFYLNAFLHFGPNVHTLHICSLPEGFLYFPFNYNQWIYSCRVLLQGPVILQ